ncbi:hypothetical protein ACROYT_G016427 [Oculina patagonica]
MSSPCIFAKKVKRKKLKQSGSSLNSNTSRNTNAEQKEQKVMSSFVKNDLIDKAQESTQDIIDKAQESTQDIIDKAQESTQDIIDKAQESTQASNYVAQESSQGINDKAQESTQGSFNDGDMVLEAAKECVFLQHQMFEENWEKFDSQSETTLDSDGTDSDSSANECSVADSCEGGDSDDIDYKYHKKFSDEDWKIDRICCKVR